MSVDLTESDIEALLFNIKVIHDNVFHNAYPITPRLIYYQPKTLQSSVNDRLYIFFFKNYYEY